MANKYHNRKVQIDGIVFDSAKEARRYNELKLLEIAGVISNLRRQVRYELVPAQYEEYDRYGKKGNLLPTKGKRCIEKAVYYVADFVYEQDGKKIVEDTKGIRTKDYIIKRKLMLYVQGIRLVEV